MNRLSLLDIIYEEPAASSGLHLGIGIALVAVAVAAVFIIRAVNKRKESDND